MTNENNNQTYDLIVLGSGGAANQVAFRAKKEGWSVAVINKGPFGGTCSVRGCIPKKVLAGSGEVADLNRRLKDLGVISSVAEMSWEGTIAFKKTFTDSIPDATEKSLKKAGIDVFVGNPKFVGDLEIEVAGKTLKAKKVHIGVGAEPLSLSFSGAEHLITSDDSLELDALPESIIFVGGGYVSFELAHVAARYGAKVTILEGGDRPLKMFDPDIIDQVVKATTEIGINIEYGFRANSIEKVGDSYEVSDGNNSYSAKLVVNGAGRPPAIKDLNLEAANIDYDPRRGITVDEYLVSTSNKNVYAAGDAADAGPPLSPVAGRQGAIVAQNLFGGNVKQPSYNSTASVLFTTPSASMVGMSEAEANEVSGKYEVIKSDTSTWFDALRVGQKHSMSKVIIEKSTKKIAGAHIVGNHAEDLINIFSLAVELGLTTDQLKQPIFAFPTGGDDVRSMF